MKNLIIQALNEATELLERQVPKTRKSLLYKSIEEVKPADIAGFMDRNGIPDTADFDQYENYGLSLCWDTIVPTTEKEQEDFRKRRFFDVAFSKLYPLLTSNGYKRVGLNSGLLAQFDDTTVYQMYKAGEFDRLASYYSLYFKKA